MQAEKRRGRGTPISTGENIMARDDFVFRKTKFGLAGEESECRVTTDTSNNEYDATCERRRRAQRQYTTWPASVRIALSTYVSARRFAGIASFLDRRWVRQIFAAAADANADAAAATAATAHRRSPFPPFGHQPGLYTQKQTHITSAIYRISTPGI